MKLWCYEIYCEYIFGQLEHIHGVVQAENMAKAEKLVREHSDRANIKWVRLCELPLSNEEQVIQICSYYDE